MTIYAPNYPRHSIDIHRFNQSTSTVVPISLVKSDGDQSVGTRIPLNSNVYFAGCS